MIEKVVSSGFKVDPPDMKEARQVLSSLHIVNCNPQCGPLPLINLRTRFPKKENYAAFVGNIDPAFIKAQVLPRGRPHFGLLHLALIDDNIATASFAVATNDIYGQKYRYIELGVVVCFHKEVFVRGSLSTLPKSTIFVDGFRVYWECLPRKDRIPLFRRGIFRVAIMGLVAEDEIPVASLEGEYFLRRSVLNIAEA